jgi:TolB-like protein/DNA-binding SARP family transcriptional activator/Flp pilus assembly protein TadD
MIRFHTLGRVDLRRGDAEVPSVLAQPKRLALLAYLASAAPRGFHSREVLLALFWPELDAGRARNALRQALFYLRRSLGAEALPGRGDREVGADPERLWCDAAAFDLAVEEGRPEDALALYGGDFLPGFFVEDAPEAERWLEDERARRQRAAADAAWTLADDAERGGRTDEAVAWARRAAGIDRDDEGSFRRLLGLLERAGRSAAALEAYAEWARRLEQDLGCAPAAETARLAAAIRERAREPAPARQGHAEPPAPAAVAVADEPVPAGPIALAEAAVSDLAPAPAPGAGVSPPAASGARRNRWGRVAATLAALVALLAPGGWYLAGPGKDPEDRYESVAVLPFQTLSSNPADRYYGDGVTEDILTQLAALGELRVTSRTSVQRYRGTTRSIPEIGRELGVDAVLEGSVRREGDRVLITAQLIDARTDRHLWAGNYNRPAHRIFETQGEIAREITHALRAELTQEERARLAVVPATDLTAYDYYLRARSRLHELARRRDAEEEVHQAVALLRQALALDPRYAPAYAGLAQAYGLLGAAEWADSGIAAANRALALDPALPQAWAAIAVIHINYGRRTEASRAVDRVLALSPSDAWARDASGFYHFTTGRLDRALAEYRLAAALEPTASDYPNMAGNANLVLGRFEAAERDFLAALRLEPDRESAHAGLVYLHVAQGDWARAEARLGTLLAIAADTVTALGVAGDMALARGDLPRARHYFERAYGAAGEVAARYLASLAYVLTRTGERDRALRLMSSEVAKMRGYVAAGHESWGAPLMLAQYAAISGDRGEAVRNLEEAYRRGWRAWRGYRATHMSPFFDGLRGDPGYERVIAAMKRDLEVQRLRVEREASRT